MWRVLVMVAVVALVAGCEARPDPCAGQPDECREAIELAVERLGPGGRERVARTEVAPEADCRLIDPVDVRDCPEEVEYAARVSFTMHAGERFPTIDVVVVQFTGDPLTVTWDSRRPAE